MLEDFLRRKLRAAAAAGLGAGALALAALGPGPARCQLLSEPAAKIPVHVQNNGGRLSGNGLGQLLGSVGEAGIHVLSTAVSSGKNGFLRLLANPPAIAAVRTPPANANGWNDTSVTVTFTCTDGGGGLAAGACPAPVVLSSEAANQSVSGTLRDLQGQSASVTLGGISIDLTPPVASLGANPPGRSFFGLTLLSTAAVLSLSAADPIRGSTASGVASLSYQIDSAAPVVVAGPNPAVQFSLSPGSHTVTYAAADLAGNTTGPLTQAYAVSDLGSCLLCVPGGAGLSGNAQVGSSSSANGGVLSNGQVTLTGSAEVYGAVTAAAVTLTGGAKVTGAVTRAAAGLQALPVNPAALVAQYSPPGNNSNSLLPPGTLSGGGLSLQGSSALALSSGTYYLTSLTVSGSAKLSVNGSVQILVNGPISISGNASFNAGSTGTLYLTQTTTAALTISGNAAEASILYAPYSALTLSGNAALSGSIYAATALLSGNAALQGSGGGQSGSGSQVLSASPSGGPDPSFKLGSVYAFPNPARAPARPTLHIEAGLADSVEVRVYDVSGALVHQTAVNGGPGVVDGAFAYEIPWNPSGAGSGVYVFAVTARKLGRPDLKTLGKFALIK